MTQQPGTHPTAADEVTELCRDLIRIDTSNYGEDRGPGERAAAEYVAAKLAEVGLDPTLVESAPGRASVVARIAGEDSSRGALLIHGHLDVVPAQAADWSHGPFEADVVDEPGHGPTIYGRGAVDMKDMDAMTLAVVRDMLRSGRRPPRDLIVAFLADEETGGSRGARWITQAHPELFEGATEAISEVGGFSYSVNDDLRLYLIETAQKGMAWMRLTAEASAGHGSFVHRDNAVTELCEAVARLGRHEFPLELTDTVRTFLEIASESLGLTLDPEHPEEVVAKLGPISRLIGATLRNTANPTVLDAGYKHNVIPGMATALVDGRFLPGNAEAFEKQLDAILGPDIRREYVYHDEAVETTFDGELVEAMSAALRAEDPGAQAVPYMLAAGTDAKHFSRLGIRCFGFAPLRLPADLDFSALFHGVDERVPVASLQFGVRVLDRLIRAS
ncbi:MAG: peptidase [Mycobacterium sp.]|nr:peptidase [Mycobacterium sp.]